MVGGDDGAEGVETGTSVDCRAAGKEPESRRDESRQARVIAKGFQLEQSDVRENAIFHAQTAAGIGAVRAI